MVCPSEKQKVPCAREEHRAARPAPAAFLHSLGSPGCAEQKRDGWLTYKCEDDFCCYLKRDSRMAKKRQTNKEVRAGAWTRVRTVKRDILVS